MEADDRVPRGARVVGLAGIAGRTVVLAFCAAFALLLTAVGGGMAVGGIGRLGETSAPAGRGTTIGGTVLAAKEETSGPQGGSRIRRIEVRFTAPDGTVRSFWESGDADVGDTIAVHYDPEHPESFTTHSAGEVRFLGVLLIVMGAALVILMPLLLVRLGLEARRARRRPPA
ncbi:hypothetical protein [Actinomadura nitritigenes]|uniref:hypothetical protein n=1 Tax=Actinomadura nitritigenes TaxID=134602 RepID=UPI003D8A6D38